MSASGEIARSDHLYALAQGQSALSAGDGATALRWLARAHRLAPKDGTAAVLYASALAAWDRERALTKLDYIVTTFRGARTAQSAMLRLYNDKDARAMPALANMLSRNVIPDEPDFFDLADRITKQSGVPGWAGMRADGTLALSRRGEIWLDGVRCHVKLSCSRPISCHLPEEAAHAAELTVVISGAMALGSPLDLRALADVEGFVAASGDGGLTGWAWRPASPGEPVPLVIRGEDQDAVLLRITAQDRNFVPRAGDGIAQKLGFSVGPEKMSGASWVRVTTLAGRELFGSPVFLNAWRDSDRNAAARLGALLRGSCIAASSAPVQIDAWRPLPVWPEMRPVCTRIVPRRAKLAVVIPVYRGRADFEACLESVLQTLPTEIPVLVVDDATPDRGLRAALNLVDTKRVSVRHHPSHLGYPGAVNTGIAWAGETGPCDIILLNADTLVAAGWIEGLADAAYSSADIGTVTPLTNDGTITSYPKPDRPDKILDQAGTRDLADHAARANGAMIVDLPTAVGFCMFIRHDCLLETGSFRTDAFAQGYGEENDFCLRARHLGFRHVAAAGVFVAHSGGRSFLGVKADMMARNSEILNLLHPGYDALVKRFTEADPLQPARAQIDRHRWEQERVKQGAVILITHALGGGVATHVKSRRVAIRALGLRPVIVRPDESGKYCLLGDDNLGDLENLRFDPATEWEALLAFLRAERPRWVELHHLTGHAPRVAELAPALGIKFDVILHDFALVCPRITLSGAGHAYCGEPLDIADCDACVADHGNRLGTDIAVADLRDRSANLLRTARQAVAPSHDTARRIARYFPDLSPVVRAWEDEFELPKPAPRPSNIRHICIAGGIGPEKGFDIVLACARDARKRRLNLQFSLVGHSVDDSRLIDAGIFVTGRYEEGEAVELIKTQGADAAFLPSVCPETWSYTLSLLWRAGMFVFAFDLGAPAERIARRGGGMVLPAGLPAGRINDVFLGERK